MEGTKKVAADNSKKKTAQKPIPESKFLVKTKGYQETFGNVDDAKKQYDFLKKRSVKSQESIKLELSELNHLGAKKILENVSIDQGFFED